MTASKVEKNKLFLLNIIFGILIVLLPIGGYLFSGLDMAKGVLLGVIVVSINYLGIQRILGKVLKDKNPVYLMAYIVKFSLSIAILFVSIYYYQINTWGLFLGLSSIFIAVSLYVLLLGFA